MKSKNLKIKKAKTKQNRKLIRKLKKKSTQRAGVTIVELKLK